jgi:transcriptional repressor NrdR
MKCPFCQNEDTQVLDTRVSEVGDSIRRRRRCGQCDRRFTTYERIELTMPTVVKRNGVRVDYDTAKLKASLLLALRKRPVSASTIDTTIGQIEEQIFALGEREINTTDIGNIVMEFLKRLDKVAYIRFASVYRNFEDISEFENVIAEITAAHDLKHTRVFDQDI